MEGDPKESSPSDYRLLSYHSLAVNVPILSGDLVLCKAGRKGRSRESKAYA
jgi:hypothetical protein